MISPQGYNYGNDPKSENPFWTDDVIKEEITATASVDNSTGTPSVDVTKNGYNFDFSFHNLKGEKGDKGDTGPQGPQGPAGSAEPELQPWRAATDEESGAFLGSPINYTQTVQNCNSKSQITVTLRNAYNDIITYKASSGTNAKFSIDPLRTGFTTDIRAGQLADFPSFIIPYVGEALSGKSHINHTFFGANDYSIQAPILELSIKPVFNADGSATFTVTIKGFYMNKVTNETLIVGANDNQSWFPLVTISLKE